MWGGNFSPRQQRRFQRQQWRAFRRYQRWQWRSYRGYYRPWSFALPFIILAIIFFSVFQHFLGILLAVLMVIGAIAVIRYAMSRAQSGPWGNNMQGTSMNNQEQQPYYQPSTQQPYYQPAEQPQPDYESYDQGYRVDQQRGEQAQPKEPSYLENYDQPQAEYPSQEPPMQQQ